MTESKIVARCTDCSAEFTAAEIQDVSACPKCGSNGVPMSPELDVTVKVNWHELRILGIWAENWANHIGPDKQTGRHPVRTLFSIVKRLQDQHPLMAPLTLSGELGELKQMQPNIEVHGNITMGAPLPMDSENEQ